VQVSALHFLTEEYIVNWQVNVF